MSLTYQFFLQDRCHLVMEAFYLAQRAANYGGIFKEKEFHLVEREEHFYKSLEEIDREFADVYDFQRAILKEAVPHFEEGYWKDLADLETIGSFHTSYLQETALSLNSESLAEISYSEFIYMNMEAFLGFFHKMGIQKPDYEDLEHLRFGRSHWEPDGEPEVYLEDVYRLLDELEISPQKKMSILRIYADPQSMYRDFKEKMAACERIIKKHFHLVEHRFQTLLEEYGGQAVDRYLLDIFSLDQIIDPKNEYLQLHLDRGCLSFDFYLSAVAYNSGSMRIGRRKEDRSTLMVGLLLLPLMEYSRKENFSRERIIEQAKAIGDNNRAKIIAILSDRPHFVKELAEKMGLSPASLSHHLAILNEAGFLQANMDERKTYYRLRPVSFKSLGSYLIRFAEDLEKDVNDGKQL